MSKPTREAILEEMRRTAALNGGRPLGMRRFHDATGISDYEWGEYWPRYSDLQREAGFDANTWSRPPLEVDFVIEKYIALLRELGRVPTDRELRLQRGNDAEFPSVKVFRRVAGTKRELVEQVLEHCQGRPEYDDVVAICEAEQQAAEADRRYSGAPGASGRVASEGAPVWGQLDLRFEEASRMLDERLADVVRREAALEQNEHHLQQALAQANEQQQARTELEETRRTLNERTAELAQRETALAQQAQELQQAPAHDPAEQAKSEEAQRRLDERTAELAQREATLVEVATRVQRTLAETAEQRSQLEQGRANVEEAQRKVEERLAEVTRHEATLGQQVQPQPAPQPIAPSPAEFAELEQLRERNDELLATLAQREAALAQKALEAQQATAQAVQAAQAEHGQVDLARTEQARREISSLLAGVAERERLVAERESHLEHALAQTGEKLDLEARAQWLTDAVKTAARQEADTVLKEAYEQAQVILANARAGHSTPALPDQPE